MKDAEAKPGWGIPCVVPPMVIATAPSSRFSTGGNGMASEEIKAVKAFIAAINRRDPSAIRDLMTEDHTFVDSGAASSQDVRA